MIVGAHVSVAGGLHNAVTKATAIGAEVLQIFVSPPQTFRVTNYSDGTIGEFKKLYQSARFRGLFLHAIYLINLASPYERSVALSIDSLIHYINMGDKLGAVGTIVHVGSFGSSKLSVVNETVLQTELASRRDVETARRSSDLENRGLRHDTLAQTSSLRAHSVGFPLLIKNIFKVLSKTPESQKLIVENCAGSKIGKDLDELVGINQAVGSDRLTFCIDTQHLFASGVDVTDREVFGQWLADFDKRIGINKLTCVHANDSKTALGSGVDRHENIGAGNIGEAGFRNILRQPLLKNIPFILEVPGTNKQGPDRENIEKLRSLLKNP